MKYYRLSELPEPEEPREGWTLDFPTILPEWPLAEPQPVDWWNERIFVHYQHNGPHTDYPHVLGEWNVCSLRLRALLEHLAPGAIQFLPIRIRSIHGTGEVEGYAVANFLQLLDCLDRERTKLGDDDWEPFNHLGDVDIEHPVLSRAPIGDARVFRVLGDSILVAIREDVKEAIQREGMTGCVFNELECI